jgi:hypothetical protein
MFLYTVYNSRVTHARLAIALTFVMYASAFTSQASLTHFAKPSPMKTWPVTLRLPSSTVYAMPDDANACVAVLISATPVLTGAVVDSILVGVIFISALVGTMLLSATLSVLKASPLDANMPALQLPVGGIAKREFSSVSITECEISRASITEGEISSAGIAEGEISGASIAEGEISSASIAEGVSSGDFNAKMAAIYVASAYFVESGKVFDHH